MTKGIKFIEVRPGWYARIGDILRSIMINKAAPLTDGQIERLTEGV